MQEKIVATSYCLHVHLCAGVGVVGVETGWQEGRGRVRLGEMTAEKGDQRAEDLVTDSQGQESGSWGIPRYAVRWV